MTPFRPDQTVPQDARSSFHGLIGIARTDITPPDGIYARNWGASQHDLAEGVHRPLTVSAVTFQQAIGGEPAILVSLDLGWWRSYKDEIYVRQYVLDYFKLAPSRLMISLTHTHSGPVICREDSDKPGGSLIPGYLDYLRKSITLIIDGALAAACECTLQWSYGSCSLACNRDLPDPDSNRVLCGYNPEGEADTTLLVGKIIGSDSRITGTIVNYACHPTTLAWANRLISPDFVGAMRELVEAEAGGICVFLQGASGELAPRRQYTEDTAIADQNGRALGFAVLSTLEGMRQEGGRLQFSGVVESGAPLAVWSCADSELSNDVRCFLVDVDMPLQSMPTLGELDDQISRSEDRVAIERFSRKRRIREAVGDGTTTSMPAWIWILGDSILVGHPNEAYSLLQTSLRDRFRGRTAAVMNVVNGHFGYLPPRDLYNLDIYPVWQSPFGAGSLEVLIESCTDCIGANL